MNALNETYRYFAEAHSVHVNDLFVEELPIAHWLCITQQETEAALTAKLNLLNDR
jgi:hypothetical protein